MASSSAGLAVEHADARRPVNLVAGKRVEVAIERLHVDFHVRHGLRAIDQNGHVVSVRQFDDHARSGLMVPSAFETCVTATSFVRGPSSFANSSSIKLAAIVDGSDAQLRALFVAQHLPGHDVRVVLHGGDQDFVAGGDVRAAVGLRDEVDAFGGAAHEDDFARVRGVQEFLRGPARRFVFFGRMLGEEMHAAMNVGVGSLVVAR